MADIPLVILAGPPWQYGDKTKMRKWLGLLATELDEMIADGVIMQPKARSRKKPRPVWSAAEAAVEKFKLERLDRYKGHEPPPAAENNSSRIA